MITVDVAIIAAKRRYLLIVDPFFRQVRSAV